MKASLLILFAATTSATSLLLPLYQYPANNGGAWSPITDALAANPSVNFKIIINPNNGPGSGPSQGINDPQYVSGTKVLAAHANAQLIGYVHTSPDGGSTRCAVPVSQRKKDNPNSCITSPLGRTKRQLTNLHLPSGPPSPRPSPPGQSGRPKASPSPGSSSTKRPRMAPTPPASSTCAT